jgi:sirohydrochlorin cobaltochelatase
VKYGEGGVLWIAHGSADPQWRATFEQLAAQFQHHAPQIPFALSYMEFCSPTASEAAKQLIETHPDLKAIRLIPLFFSNGGHVSKDIQKLAVELKAEFPDVQWSMTQAMGENRVVQDAILSQSIESVLSLKMI